MYLTNNSLPIQLRSDAIDVNLRRFLVDRLCNIIGNSFIWKWNQDSKKISYLKRTVRY